MTKRTIADEEISLMKAMINRGMKNKDIQFFFNRPARSVNSGRISGIRSGAYSNSATIKEADDATLNDFIAKFKPTGVSATIGVPTPAHVAGPTSQPMLAAMFKKEKSGIWRFQHRESDRHECKENFGFKYADKWLRAVAALANNDGGYVIFGVKDRAANKLANDSYQVIGMNNLEFENADPVDFTKRIKSPFDPTPRVEHAVLNLDGMKVGILYVHQHPSRPVIATKSEGDQVREGDIYFRYPGQSTRVKYSDLRAILDDRDRQAREQILPMVSKLLSLGPRDAMVADLANGILSDEKRSILIGEDLLDRIKFIRQGEFKEIEGELTLRLVGDVHAVQTKGGPVHKAYVTPGDLLDEFLNLKSPSDPKEYIRCAVEGSNGAWLPMHYYARQSSLKRHDLADFIMKTAAPPIRRKMYRDRALGKKSAYMKYGGQAASMRLELEEGSIPEIKNVTEATSVGYAVASLESKPVASLDDMLGLLKRAIKILHDNDKPGAMSAVRRGVARLDELYFAEKA